MTASGMPMPRPIFAPVPKPEEEEEEEEEEECWSWVAFPDTSPLSDVGKPETSISVALVAVSAIELRSVLE
jgi:hypothetical protein